MALRFFIILAVFLLLQVYIGWHVDLFIAAAGWHVPGGLFWPVFSVVSLGYLLARMLRRVLPRAAADGLKWIGSYWIAIIQYSVLLLPFADLAAWVLREAALLSHRESILWTGVAVIAAFSVLLVKGSHNAWSPVVRSYEVNIPKSAVGIRQLSIAAASDLHLGTTVGRRHLQRLVDRVNELQPDLMLLPGDVLDDDVTPFIKHGYARKLAEIKATYGTYAILGNHEYYGGGITEFVRAMKEVGIPVLLDETVTIADQVYLIGRKDKTDRGRKKAAELVAGLNGELPIILMDHQPAAIAEIADAGVDLSVHGHTHRGQMAPNHLVTKRIFELDYGYLLKGRLHAFVSSGFGTWGPPIRIGSRSEILSIIVRFESESDNK
ncbi:metallophosphoesterase [Paenibacillus montanisoli]|uniref:Metallophosphoesterase n=1 Tax=Paenibacillus montanisoli TaxID=2081970 RepID=A0A328U8Z8_9BACL|nr:metallophosphoesterase [Paenibacillus montanisoli]RAP77801.1 metallophosphoesterase [Paenibacillus montanisoli]